MTKATPAAKGSSIKTLYLVNLLPHTLTIKADMKIPADGYRAISEIDEKDSNVLWAVTRDWAVVTDVKPEEPTPQDGISLYVHEPYKGLSAEELKKEQEAEKAAGKNGVTSTAIGRPETEAETKAKSEAIGKKAAVA